MPLTELLLGAVAWILLSFALAPVAGRLLADGPAGRSRLTLSVQGSRTARRSGAQRSLGRVA